MEKLPKKTRSKDKGTQTHMHEIVLPVKKHLFLVIDCKSRLNSELFKEIIPNGVGAGCTAGSRSEICSGDLAPSGSVSGDLGGDFFASSPAFLLSSSSRIRFSRSRISYCKEKQ